LDFFRNISEPTIQAKVFREQMELAQEMKKPVIFHNREADDDVVSILSGYPGMNGVAHCFSGDLAIANSFLKLGYYISFSGNLTFKNSNLPRVAKQLPLERLMVETDSPYLSPVPFRGKPNEPGRTRFVAERLAEIQGISIETVASQTSENAKCLFGLKSKLP
jgi:TatD DNase family protein